MIYKGNADEDEDNDASLHSLLKCLPNDFDDGALIDYFDDEEEDENGLRFGTMIIKLDRNQTTKRLCDFKRASFDDEGDGSGFSTFVVRLSSER
ncbi:serine/threonine-protein kinase 4-like [Pyrus ussuriensis x Pyrus communis]|uniref:Serine/threonine-protein kinase 4-like n=1 Tax=Pyrus ussuriensis x Pyrus communis TaxID=2448454 RepID=A0A5N5FU94_9ROSA|nr:serine/threonine-protein kinase 4-like [Pyrus ussuriensis x Pyrus communis]